MLDLQPRVHLDEIKRVRVGDELDRARVDIVHGRRRGARGCRHLGAAHFRHRHRGRFLHHLLMAALQGAFALVERDHVAVRIAEHLDLDVPWPRDVFLKEQRIVAECSLRLAFRACERVLDLACRLDAPHAPPASAGGRLDKNGKSDALRCVPHRRGALIGPVIARHDRHAGGLHARFRLRL